jgi:hypothetical protein
VWVETVSLGGNIIAGTDPSLILSAVDALPRRDPDRRHMASAGVHEAFGAGNASRAILTSLLALHANSARH